MVSEIRKKCEAEPDKIHVLFIDEISHASRMMKERAYGIILDKQVSQEWKLPKNVRVIAAGNEVEDSFISEELPTPLYKRFAHIDVETDAKKWLKWAITPDEDLQMQMSGIPPVATRKNKVHPMIAS